MNTTSHRVYQTGEGERGSEVAANDLGRLRIRLGISTNSLFIMMILHFLFKTFHVIIVMFEPKSEKDS